MYTRIWGRKCVITAVASLSETELLVSIDVGIRVCQHCPWVTNKPDRQVVGFFARFDVVFGFFEPS